MTHMTECDDGVKNDSKSLDAYDIISKPKGIKYKSLIISLT